MEGTGAGLSRAGYLRDLWQACGPSSEEEQQEDQGDEPCRDQEPEAPPSRRIEALTPGYHQRQDKRDDDSEEGQVDRAQDTSSLRVDPSTSATYTILQALASGS